MLAPIMLHTVESRVREAVAGPVHRTGDAPVTTLEIDSRAVLPGALFACVRGGDADGHRFAAAAVRAGAAALLVDRPLQPGWGVPQLQVPSVRAVLGPVGALLAGDPGERMRLVGVTGTNGKTTTSALVHAALEAAGRRAGVVGTLGARVGDQEQGTGLTTPEAPQLQRLLAWMAGQGATDAVVEASSIGLDVGRLDALRFDVAVFTGFEEDHLDHHGTLEQYWASKAALFAPGRAGHAVVSVDEPWGRRLADQARVPVTRVGRSGGADVRVLSWDTGRRGTEVLLADGDGEHRLRSALLGEVNVGNLAVAWATARRLGLPAADVTAGLAGLTPPPGRNTLVTEPGAPRVLVDYAHTPRALRAALRTAHGLAGGQQCVHLVLGARGRRDRAKRQLLGVEARLANRVWLTNEGSHGENPRQIVEELRVGLIGGPSEVSVELDRRAAITAAVRAADPGDVVLVVGRGHETQMQDSGPPVHLDDAEVAREAVADYARAARGRAA
ncbi:Mur ligase family protein [Goekera deserti]|nr:UDP-N-acetylmuramoyl-L-alanyl-D-glutamate--2,6-diaminopimelate ligase [Goekera deserti]